MNAITSPGSRSEPATESRAAHWHAVSIVEALEGLSSDPAGLTGSEADERLARYGPNVLPEPTHRSVAAIVLGQLKSPLIYLLIGAAVVAGLMEEWPDAVFICLVLGVNTAIGAIQEANAERRTAALRSSVRGAVRVKRDGAIRTLPVEVLVPGDVVLLEGGDKVPADLRLIFAADLKADESSLTGESLPVDKVDGAVLPTETILADRLNMLHAGTIIQRGRCEALVVLTGRDTALGQMAEALALPSPLPPLTQRLNRFTRMLGTLALVLVAIVVALRLASGAGIQDTLYLAIALAVSVIPEGLPVAVTVALSIATARMARRNVVVRQLPAVEGLGACTVVATDKTGTLTVNQLTAKRIWLPEVGMVEVAGEGYSTEGSFTIEGNPLHESGHLAVRSLSRSATLSNDASFVATEEKVLASGDTVDIAFLVLAAKSAIEAAKLRASAPRVAEIPFTAERRYSASINLSQDQHELHLKGAPESILPLCPSSDPEAVTTAVAEMAAEGYRVLAIASKPIAPHPLHGVVDPEAHLHDLTLLGLVGFIDPLRPEAVEAVSTCRKAGVAVKMITGDHAGTALAIAHQLGIAASVADVVTGTDLSAMDANDASAKTRLSKASVFARVEPAQKVLIVDLLRADGHFVAMTGDGVNDAPALARADLGVAMGRGGTDAARDAADLVLTDDNFASIVSGIEEGRAAYANIRKVIYLLISTGLAEVVIFILSLVSGLPVPLTAVQLLWLNLVTNGGQDVALAYERAEPGLLDKRPRSPQEPIFDALMIRQTLISGGYMGLVAYGLSFWLYNHGFSEFDARNLVLFLMVAFENVHTFNCRSETRSVFRIPLSANRPLLAAVVAAQAVHIGAAFVPGIREVLGVAPIELQTWLMLMGVALSLLLVMEGYKLLQDIHGRQRATGG